MEITPVRTHANVEYIARCMNRCVCASGRHVDTCQSPALDLKEEKEEVVEEDREGAMGQAPPLVSQPDRSREPESPSLHSTT